MTLEICVHMHIVTPFQLGYVLYKITDWMYIETCSKLECRLFEKNHPSLDRKQNEKVN